MKKPKTVPEGEEKPKKTYICKGCKKELTNFGHFRNHIKDCAKFQALKDQVKTTQKVEAAKEIPTTPVKEKKAGGATTIRVTPVTVEKLTKQRTKPRETDQVKHAPITEKIRREMWECRKCTYTFYPQTKPAKCPNCGSPKIQIKVVEEQIVGAPKLDSKLFLPLVIFPYSMWADKAEDQRLKLSPAEEELLAENVASVANYYMSDLMIKHGVIVALILSVAIVTTPKIYMARNPKGRKSEEEIERIEEGPTEKIERSVPTAAEEIEQKKEEKFKTQTPGKRYPSGEPNEAPGIEKRLNRAWGGK